MKGTPELGSVRYLLVGLVGGIVLAGAIYCLHWRQSPKRVSLIPPHRRFRYVPWSGMELLLVLCLYVGGHYAAMLFLQAIGILL